MTRSERIGVKVSNHGVYVAGFRYAVAMFEQERQAHAFVALADALDWDVRHLARALSKYGALSEPMEWNVA